LVEYNHNQITFFNNLKHKTLVLGSRNLNGVTDLQAQSTKVGDRENLDRERGVLTPIVLPD